MIITHKVANQQVRSTANIYRKTRTHFLRCSAPSYFPVYLNV